MHIIEAANAEHEWKLNYGDVMQLWRGGCIIQSDDMLDEVYKSSNVDRINLLAHPIIAKALASTMGSHGELTIDSLRMDSYVPAMTASLEYLKYSISTDLPTSFQEAELDFFGHHNYDLKSEGAGEPIMGKHHFEWRPARGFETLSRRFEQDNG